MYTIQLLQYVQREHPPVPPISQGDDYMVPFSPARSPAASPNDSPKQPPNSGTPGVTMASEKAETAVVAVAGGVGEASTAGTPAPTGTTALTPDISPTGAARGGGGGGIFLDGMPATKPFIFSDDDESEEEEVGGTGRGTTMHEGSDQQTGNTKSNGGGGSVDGGEVEKEQSGSDATSAGGGSDTAAIVKGAGSGGGREERRKQGGHRVRRRRSKGNSNNDKPGDQNSSSDNVEDGESEPADEHTRRRDRREALLNPLGLPQGMQFDDGGVDDSDDGNRTSPPGEKRGVVDSACATPAPGAWAAPDFGFSSDDDLDIEFSASSVERSGSGSSTIEKGES